MDKKDIIKIYKDKGFNQESIDLLINAIDDFDLFLNKYVSKEELIDRIQKNLDNIEFKNLKVDGALGKYEKDTNTIIIDETLKDRLDILGSVFFHEFLHMVTNVNEKNTVRISHKK